jgi:hypothetical protein
MPPIDKRTSALVNLYNLCKKSNTLPFAGPLMHQPAWIMDLFQHIDAIIDQSKSEQLDKERMEIERQRMRSSPEWRQTPPKRR